MMDANSNYTFGEKHVVSDRDKVCHPDEDLIARKVKKRSRTRRGRGRKNFNRNQKIVEENIKIPEDELECAKNSVFGVDITCATSNPVTRPDMPDFHKCLDIVNPSSNGKTIDKNILSRTNDCSVKTVQVGKKDETTVVTPFTGLKDRILEKSATSKHRFQNELNSIDDKCLSVSALNPSIIGEYSGHRSSDEIQVPSTSNPSSVGASHPEPLQQDTVIPELNLSDFTIQFEDERPKKRKRERRNDVNERSKKAAESVNDVCMPPELNISDFTIQFEDEGSQGNNQGQAYASPATKTPPKKKRRHSRMSTDIDFANIIISPADSGADNMDVPLPMSSMRRSSRLRRKSVELYRRSFITKEESSDNTKSESTDIDSEDSPITQYVPLIVTGTEQCSISPQFLKESPKHDDPFLKNVETNLTSVSNQKVVSRIEDNLIESTGMKNIDSDMLETKCGDKRLLDEPSVNPDLESIDIKDCSANPVVKPSADKKRGRVRSRSASSSPVTSVSPDTPSPLNRRSRRIRKAKEPEMNLEDLYRNKNFKMPESKSWETIYESPRLGQGELGIGKKKMKRSLMFEESPNIQAKYKKRRKKAIKNGWKPLSKAKLEKADKKLFEKLKLFEEELELFELENTKDCTGMAVNICESIERDISPVLVPRLESELRLDDTSSNTDGIGLESVFSASDDVFSPSVDTSEKQMLPSVPVDDVSIEASGIAEFVEGENTCNNSTSRIDTEHQIDDKITSPEVFDKERHPLSSPCSADSPMNLVDNSTLGACSSAEKADAVVLHDTSSSLPQRQNTNSDLPGDGKVNKDMKLNASATCSSGEKPDELCCLWSENTCDWSSSTASSTGVHDLAAIVEEDEEDALSVDGSGDSEHLEDERLHHICQTHTTSGMESTDQHPENLVEKELACSRTPSSVRQVDNKQSEGMSSVNKVQVSTATPLRPPEQSSKSENERAQTYWEKMRVFQNIFS